MLNDGIKTSRPNGRPWVSFKLNYALYAYALVIPFASIRYSSDAG